MKKIFKISILIFAIGIMAYSGYKLISIYLEYVEGDKLYESYANDYMSLKTIELDENGGNEKEEEPKGKKVIVDFESLLADNKDVVGWIYSEGTPINYPIVQSYDNDYYLRRMLDRSYNIAGSIFMDFRNSSDLTDLNTIIYGHNMKNNTMFGSLKEYRSQEYYEEHPVLYLSTPDKDYKIELIAGYQTDISSNIYHIPNSWEELKSLYGEIKKLSEFKSETSLEEGDRLVTLSTCTLTARTDRFVLVGKLIEI